MGHSSFTQTSFLGGLWSALAQGRMDSERYKTALNVCENYYPIEQGSLLRRQGTRYLAHTRRGNKAKLIPFDFSIIQPYQLEVSNLFMRFYQGPSLVFTDPSHGVIDVSTATPAVITLSEAADWATGDDVIFEISGPPCRAPLLCNRQFTLTKLTTTTFSLADALTGAAINGATIAWTAGTDGDLVFRILEVASPYTTANLPGLHFVQDETTLTLLHSSVKPYILASGGTFFTLTAASFTDGPYLDENTTTTTFTPSGTSGSVTITASATTGINDGDGFATTDVGRLIRLRSVAAAWSSGTTYAVGDLATGTDGQVYSSLTASNLNHNPVNDVTNWAVSPGGVVWNWATITARASTTSITATLHQIDGLNLLNATATLHWRLGLWSDTTGWPTCGGYHEGRLWFGGSAGNRFDGSKSGDHYNFAPTSSDGTVADDNAVAGTFTAHDVNQILWFLPEADGLYAGTQAGEWRIKSSSLDDPITPSSLQARRVTTFGTADQQALCTPRTILFTQRQKRKIFEFAEFDSGIGPDGINLSLTAEHITVGGIEELVYQMEPTPMVWARVASGDVIGCSYKRDPDKAYAGWHEVFLGGDQDTRQRTAESLSVGPDQDGLSEVLFLVTRDPDDDTKPRFVEMMTPMFDDNVPDHKAWFVDTGIVPCCAELTSGNLTVGNVTFYGLSALDGKTVCPFVGGLDLGERVVSGGAVTVAWGSDPDAKFTASFLAGVAAQDLDYGDYAVNILVADTPNPDPTVTVPSVLGYDGTAAGPSGNVSHSDSTSVVVDWENGYVYTHNAGNTSTDGMRKFLLDSPATLAAEATTAQIGLPNNGVGVGTGAGIELMTDGKIVMITDSQNSGEVSSMTAGLVYGASFGVTSSSTSPSNSTRILGPNIFAPMKTPTGNYLVNATSANSGEIYVLPVDNNFSGGGVIVGNVDEAKAYVCRGHQHDGYGDAYALGTRNWAGGATAATDPVGIYRVGVSAMVKSGTFSPANVDATWTNFSNVRGLAFDQTDGNLLTVVQTTDAVTNKQYVIKVKAATGAVMWASPVNQVAAGIIESMSRSRIKYGTFFYIGSGGVVYQINTADGSTTTQTFGGVGSIGQQVSDDVSNSVIGFGSAGGAGVVEIGDWMDTQGHGTVTNFWVRVFLGTINGQSRGQANTIYTVGAPIGFCYTSRWQLLRPDYGNDAGAQQGPAFGKKRRNHWWAGSFYRTRNIEVGTDFSRLYPVKFETEGRTAIDAPTLFSGIVSTPVQDDYSFKGQICGEQTTAYPSVILAIGGYISTTDK